MRASVEEHLSFLNQEIKRTEELIRTHINNHPGLKQQSQLLDSIPGIAETTAALLLSEITDITQYRSAHPSNDASCIQPIPFPSPSPKRLVKCCFHSQ